MHLVVRPAESSDVENILEIKAALSIRPDQDPHPGGGFLIEADVDAVLKNIRDDIVLVAEDPENKCLAGYAKVLRHDTVMTDLWPRRGNAALSISTDVLANGQMAWFDQLGMRMGHQYRRHAPLLALRATVAGLEGHTVIGAAVMKEPAPNINSLRLLDRAGFRNIGSISEDLPDVGHVASDIYMIDKETFERNMTSPGLKRLVDWVVARAPITQHRPAVAASL